MTSWDSIHLLANDSNSKIVNEVVRETRDRDTPQVKVMSQGFVERWTSATKVQKNFLLHNF